MSQAAIRPDSKVAELRSVARFLEVHGEDREDDRMSELLVQIAIAYEHFQQLDPAPIDEAIRWTPVLYAAVRAAREIVS